MVDWSDKKLNHKFWVMMALLQTLDTEYFSFCETTYEGSEAHTPLHGDRKNTSAVLGNGIFAQGLQSSKGRVLVLINTRSASATTTVPGAAGKRTKIIDSLVGNEQARESTLVSYTIELGPFAVIIVQF